MVSRELKGAALHEKLQLLRSVTKSHALNKASIIADASNYIQELQQKVERLNQEITSAQIEEETPMPVVNVETLNKGFLINVLSEKSCPGLLVSILEAFEELGLTVLEARVSCDDTFHLEAVGENKMASMDSHVMKQAVLQAIKDCYESSEQD
ncbi:hypothetical protein J5N97_013937 [Dioscorea zingiberensis]|uniref:Plant bHLH transcription factor ACT-like domain-containing protein n=1 Tax=Dioscorea zingiberensis TaxID=325984 RepID=A0A9D5CS72_9LILI|nr:hypothetical protein J5N97_013937 [Dioscorea zingiberensis]